MHHIGMDLDETKRLCDLADLTEMVDELKVRSVSIYNEGAPTGLLQ